MHTDKSINWNFKRIAVIFLSILAILALAFPMSGSALANGEPLPFSLTIRAYIDGYSQLIIQGSSVTWHHIGAAAPGRHNGSNEPTYLNGAEWYPNWPDDPTAENLECNCDSSTVSDLIPALPQGQTFVLNVVQARWSTRISQQPEVGNGYELIIDFDDWPPDGPAWYEVELVPGALPVLDGEHQGTEGIAHANSCNAYGWAQDPDATDREVQVRIIVDGNEATNEPTIEHAFRVNLWGISNYVKHIVKAQAYDVETDQWVDLAGTPKLLTCVNYDIYLLNTMTGLVERLTELEDKGEYNPSWAPGGHRIVHDVADADSHALYITDVYTHVSTPLPGGDGGNDASWSPNGYWILFDRRWSDDSNLYILPPTGGTPRLVVSNAVNGDWAPYSQRIVFERDGALWTANMRGGEEKKLVEAGNNPVWSPDGMWIAYDLDGDIWKVRVNAFGARIGVPIHITKGPASDGGPAWSPDSRKIAYSSDLSGDNDIWQVSAFGGAPTRLVKTNIYGDYDPDYANYGQYLAYDGARMPAQPYIVAFPEWGYIEGQDWPMGDTVHLTIDDPRTWIRPDYEAGQETVANDWGTWWVQFNFDYDLKVGDRVSESDGYMTRSYTVQNLAVNAVNPVENTVTGTTVPGAVVYLWVWDHDVSYIEVHTTRDGRWLADFDSVGFDLGVGMCGRAEVRDNIGNRTAVEWCAPYQTVADIGMVTGIGGVDDKGFNSLAWKGITDAVDQLGVEGKYLTSNQPSDYAANIQQLLDENQDLIVTVSFFMGIDTANAAKANPDQIFSIVDYTYPDCWEGAVEGTDCGSSTALANVRSLAFQTDQAAFLAGYLAAGMTETDTVATFGGMQIPSVTIFMKGFEAGVKYYNMQHNDDVQLLGWDDATQTGLFAGSFGDFEAGKAIAESLVTAGADIIFPVAGPLGFGSACYCQDSSSCLVIGVDTDWFEAAPDYESVELSSVLKKVDVAVYKTIEDGVNGMFTSGTVTYDLADEGVGLAPFHEFDDDVPQSLKDEIDQARTDLISGLITVDGVLAQ